MRRILAIDGGGIRGIIPALALVEIESRTGKRIAEMFDLIAGTSTGGILAAGLCVPGPDGGPKYAASDLVDLYRVHGGEIFSASLPRKVASVAFGAEYSPRNLELSLRKKLGDARLADAVTGLLVTAYDMRAGEAWFFRGGPADKPAADRNYLLRDVARATSAAPTYFPPFKFTDPRSDDPVLVDGGMFANNPALCAWVDKQKLATADAEVLILSLGTGSLPHPVTFSRARRWGKVLWAQPVIGGLLDGQSDTTEYELGQLLDEAHYLRLQVKLPVGNEKMDNASLSNIAALEQAAGRMLSDPDNDRRLRAFCDQLIAAVPA